MRKTDRAHIWYLPHMINLILATEAASSNPPGDELQTIAYIALGITMVVTAVATVIITPKADKH